MKKFLETYLVVQFIIFFQYTVFFLKPFGIGLESELGRVLSTIITLFFFVSSLYFSLMYWQDVRYIVRKTPLLNVLLLCCALSVAWSMLPLNGTNKLVNLTLQLAQVLSIIAISARWRLNLYTLMRVAAGVAVSLNFAYYLLSPAGALSKTLGESGRYECLLTQPNSLGQLCAITYILWLPLSFREIRFRHIAVIALSLYCLLLSGSSTSLLIVIIASLIRLLYVFRHNALRLPVTVCALLLIGFSFFGTANIFNSINRDTTLTGRTFIWGYALQEIQNDDKIVFGYGLGGFWDPTGNRKHTDDMLNSFMQVHNGYLETYLQLGYMGAILLLLLLIHSIVLIWRNRSDPLYANLCLVLIAILISNVSESSFIAGKHPYWLLFSLLYSVLATRFVVTPSYATVATNRKHPSSFTSIQHQSPVLLTQ